MVPRDPLLLDPQVAERGEGVDPGVVEAAELENRRVVDATPAVLFEPTPMLDQAGDGDRAIVS